MKTVYYKVDKVENGIRYLSVYLDGKLIAELECLGYIYYNREEVQMWLDANGYEDIEFNIEEMFNN